ncbi:MAG: hypothetical protein AB7Q97_05995 [Gammaproteobacteria bacterium]
MNHVPTQSPPPLRIALALSLTALTTLAQELALTRVFDVVLTPNMAYMVIACTLFSFGLGGIWSTLRPLPQTADPSRVLARITVALAVATLALRPVLNALPFDYEALPRQPLLQFASFTGMYLAMVVPFFLSGLVFAIVFSTYPHAIQRLYCWDLSGAALGCVALIPLLPPIGPGGVLMSAAALNLVAAALFDARLRFAIPAGAAAMVLVALPILHAPAYFDFTDHLHKRGVLEARERGWIELSRWDPVSKIDVIDLAADPVSIARGPQAPARKHVAYDGGTQSTHIFAFDGDFTRLRRAIEERTGSVFDHFWHRGVLLSHYLKRDTGERALVIGAAGGQETKAALMYGATHVDAVEMVSTVVDLGRNTYSRFNGGIFNDPRVALVAGEGRAFLRASRKSWDVIQIHSNHTSSSIAAGTGAMAPDYLQTADAYREYFTHLAPGGILHINHHIYPRMITTAALAWRQLGRTDFQRHVLVFEFQGVRDTLPTMLVKTTPWSAPEVEAANEFMTAPWTTRERVDIGLFFEGGADNYQVRMVQNPLDPAAGFLPPEFFSGSYSRELANRVGFRAWPTTDDRPFFGFIRTAMRHIEPDPERYINFSVADTLNSQLRGGVVAMDVVHLQITAAVSLLFAIAFVLVPLRWAPIGKSRWSHRAALVTYFACLGCGFIILELVFVQIFMKLIGVPLYTYAVVIFTLLFGAGVGSAASRSLGIGPHRRWPLPFFGAIACGLVLLALHSEVFEIFLAAPALARAAVAAAMIFPLGFFLGMPFPLGILAIAGREQGAITWAWSLNGLFTVIGSLASVILALWFGFHATVLAALAIYAVAGVAFSRLRAP